MKILFATDFEPDALQVLEQLERLAAGQRTHVLLMHVTSTWQAFLSSGLTERQAEDRLKSWGQRLQANGHEVEVAVERGNATERILETAELWGADRIAVGAGAGWREGLSVGTTAQGVVRNAAADVFVGVPSERGLAKILCGYDGSGRALVAVQSAIALAEHLAAEVTVLGAIGGPEESLLGTSPEEERRLAEDHKSQRAAEFEKAVTQLPGSARLERAWVWGRGVDALRAKAEDDSVDLIVLGRSGAGQVRRALLGTTAERLLRRTPCSLLVVGGPADRAGSTSGVTSL